MSDKKNANFDSPDLRKLQAVEIDKKTTIYIPLKADPEEARMRFLARSKSNAKAAP